MLLRWNISVYYEATGEKKEGYPIVVTSNPLDNDTDDDGLLDGQEFENATNPNEADTDGDLMSDLWEITGPEPSDPCGVEGTPPNITKLRLDIYEDDGEHYLKVQVRVKDNIGLYWVLFKVRGRNDWDWKVARIMRFSESTNNTTVSTTFKVDYFKAATKGFKINVTASDVNLNAGYKTKEVDSVWERILDAILGALKALAEFIMELVSAAIEWIWDCISSMVKRTLDPIISASSNNLDIISDSIEQVDLDSKGIASEESIEEIALKVLSPFYFSIFILITVIIIIMSIIQFFIFWLVWLLTAVVIIVLAIFFYVLFVSDFSEDDYEQNKDMSEDESCQFNEDGFKSYGINKLNLNSNQEGRNHRDAYEDFNQKIFELSFIIGILNIFAGIATIAGWYMLKYKSMLILSIVLFLFGAFCFFYGNIINTTINENPDNINSQICLLALSYSLLIASLVSGLVLLATDWTLSTGWDKVIGISVCIIAYFGKILTEIQYISSLDTYIEFKREGKLTNVLPWDEPV